MDAVHTHSLRLLPRLMGDTTSPERQSSLRETTLQEEEGDEQDEGRQRGWVERTGKGRRTGRTRWGRRKSGEDIKRQKEAQQRYQDI